ANGILYNSPYLQTEVCACPDFTQSEETVKNIFIVTNYELKFDLLRAYGNLNEIEGSGDRRLFLKLHETSNASGTVVSFHDKYGNLIAQVHESIFIKIGKADENNVILNTIISTAAGAAIGAATGGVGAAFAAEATSISAGAMAGAAKGATASAVGSFAGGVKEQDNELINRYHANRTLKGIEGNQYFNTAILGNYLTKNQYFKAKIITLNMW
ncbi:3481_t:CDS:2, partial [Funneliformis geosporum]